MTRMTLWAALGIALMLWGTVAHGGDKPQAPQLPKHWKFSLPKGDAEAGRAAFEKMECYSCHKVPGAGLPRERTSGGVGPTLTRAYSQLPAEFLAESIIDSHKYIAGTLERYKGLDKVSSKMGDYSSIMSVRELIDIVAFLKHLPGGPAPEPK